MQTTYSLFSTAPYSSPNATVMGGPQAGGSFPFRYTHSAPTKQGKHHTPHARAPPPSVGKSGSGFTVLADAVHSSHFFSTTSSSSDEHGMPPPGHPSTGHRDKRLHQDFKALSKTERQRFVQREAADSDLLDRTVHLRFLPTSMKQGELALMCRECGPYLRVRICGNSTDNQNWIYGFVEFETREGAEKLMQLNGRELSNGEGRPLLRLKCHTANQPIVDRVFHDADPASQSPCIFGQGSFENRTLKDALDSYFNLKAKERQQHFNDSGSGVMDGESPPGSLGSNLSGQHSSTEVNLSAAPSSIGKNQLRANAQVFVPPNSHRAHAPANGGPFTAIEEEEFSEANFSVSNPPTPERSSLPLQGLSSTMPVACPQLSVISTGGAAAVEEEVLPSSSSVAVVQSKTVGLPGPDEPDALLNLTLETLIANNLAVNGEEVVHLCCTLVQRAFKQGTTYLSSRREFFDTIGTLKQLLEKLDTHEGLTGRACDTVALDYTSDLPQKVTQLRLLANLMLTLLHLAPKRSWRDALPFTKALVNCVREIPQKPLEPPPMTGEMPTMMPFSSSAVSGIDELELSLASPLGRDAQLLQTVLEEEEEDPLSAAAVLSVAATTGGTTESLSDRQILYLRDVRFHQYVLNVLLCAGIAMEEVAPTLSAQLYYFAINRAEKVLGVSSEVVQRCYAGMSAAAAAGKARSAYPKLGDEVLGRPSSVCAESPQREVTAFPRFFFQSASAFFQQVQPEDETQFWAVLPPMHIMNFFTQTSF